MVRGPFEYRPGRLGAVELRHTGEFAGEALVVSWQDIEKRRRVSAQFRNKREFSRPRVREQSGTAEHFVALRGTCLSLQDQRGQRRKGTHLGFEEIYFSPI